MSRSPLRNPFYVVTMVVGTLFAIHATAYALWYAGIFEQHQQAEPHALVQWLETSGDRWLAIELIVLCAATVAAMATEAWWRRE